MSSSRRVPPPNGIPIHWSRQGPPDQHFHIVVGRRNTADGSGHTIFALPNTAIPGEPSTGTPGYNPFIP